MPDRSGDQKAETAGGRQALRFGSRQHLERRNHLLTMTGAFWLALLMAAGAVINNSAVAVADLRLVAAVRSQDVQQVRTLLNQRVDVNARSGDGSTALLWAAHWNALETAALLIRAGADANVANDFR